MQTRKRHSLSLVPEETVPNETIQVERRKSSGPDRRAGERRRFSLVGPGFKEFTAEKDPFVFTETEKFRAVFECVSDALVTVNRQGQIELVNPATEELTGYLRDELTGRPLDSLSPKGAPSARTRPLTRSIYSTPGTYEDISIETKDGQLRIVDLSVRVVIATDSTFSIVVFRDVTEKKRMERELLTKHAELRNAFVDLERINT
jgi:PAS domain S-box-containing protein